VFIYVLCSYRRTAPHPPLNTHLLFVTPTPFAADATAAAGDAFFPECPSAPFALASDGFVSAGVAWPLPIINGVYEPGGVNMDEYNSNIISPRITNFTLENITNFLEELLSLEGHFDFRHGIHLQRDRINVNKKYIRICIHIHTYVLY
jgi:hypothetical protein